MTFPRFLYSFYEASLTRKLEKEELRRHLYSPGLTDIDLVIRTSGESRLSGFYYGSLPTQVLYLKMCIGQHLGKLTC